MQRYIMVRLLQNLLTLWVMGLIVFSLARLTGDPLDVPLPMEAGEGERERIARHWGLDKPLFVNVAHPLETQYWSRCRLPLAGERYAQAPSTRA